MCELCLPRRGFLAGATGLVLGAALGSPAARAAGAAAAAVPVQAGVPPVVPRSEWAPDLLPVGPVPDEADVRFLLVHHTVNGNDYSAEQSVDLLRGIYSFHTSPEKGWPDIAYNFLIDRFGTVFEGRTGSLEGAKAADATGGSQGFAQLCCFIGDHSLAPPAEPAMAAMVGMLAFLGDRHGLDLSPGAVATFVSRGSSRRPEGTEVTTPTISGHRDMSSTACPGDFAYAFVEDGTFARLATAARGGTPTTTEATSTTTTATSTSATTSSTEAPTGTTSTTGPGSAPSTMARSTASTNPGAAGGSRGTDATDLVVPGATAAVVLAATAGALALRARRLK